MSRPTLHIVKIGGKLINDTDLLKNFLHAFSLINEPKLLVHGGGQKATELSALLGIESRIIDGRRVTNQETLDIAVMVYAGLINKQIVGHLQGLGNNSLGMTGADFNVIKAHKREVGDIDYGFVGDIDRVGHETLHSLIEKGVTPVICAITHDGDGQLLNTNADTIASEVAVAMTSIYRCKLSFCFEYKGVLYDLKTPDFIMDSLSNEEYESFKKEGVIEKGMIPKLSNGFNALLGGVADVRICGVENLSRWQESTKLKL